MSAIQPLQKALHVTQLQQFRISKSFYPNSTTFKLIWNCRDILRSLETTFQTIFKGHEFKEVPSKQQTQRQYISTWFSLHKQVCGQKAVTMDSFCTAVVAKAEQAKHASEQCRMLGKNVTKNHNFWFRPDLYQNALLLLNHKS